MQGVSVPVSVEQLLGGWPEDELDDGLRTRLTLEITKESGSHQTESLLLDTDVASSSDSVMDNFRSAICLRPQNRRPIQASPAIAQPTRRRPLLHSDCSSIPILKKSDGDENDARTGCRWATAR